MQNTQQPKTAGKGHHVVLRSLLLAGAIVFGYAHAHATFSSMGFGTATWLTVGSTSHAESYSPFTQLIDTRDHDDTNVAGERIKKDKPVQKNKTDKSVKHPQRAKARSDESRGTEDRRDLKEDHHPQGERAQDKGTTSSKERSDEPRGTDDRRDLKDNQ